MTQGRTKLYSERCGQLLLTGFGQARCGGTSEATRSSEPGAAVKTRGKRLLLQLNLSLRSDQDAGGSEAHWLETLQLEPGQAILRSDGKVGKYQYFSLGSPPRLVVDLYGVHPRFKERSLMVPDGFKQVRIGKR